MNIVIVGAGIAGLSVARALMVRGCRPTIIAPDSGYTATGAGIVSAQFWDSKLAPLARRSQEIIRKSISVSLCGMVQIALSKIEAGRLDRIDGARRVLPKALVSVFSPRFLDRILRTTYLPGDFWVRTHDLLRVFARGSRIIRSRVRRFEETGAVTEDGFIKADRLVVAMGSWTRRFMPCPGVQARVSRLARVQTRLPIMFHVLDTGLYGRPDGREALLGDGDAPWTSDHPPGNSSAFLAHMQKQTRRVFIETGTVRSAGAGVILMTPTRRPVVQRRGNRWILTGFGGDGLALAPAIGERVAREILS